MKRSCRFAPPGYLPRARRRLGSQGLAFGALTTVLCVVVLSCDVPVDDGVELEPRFDLVAEWPWAETLTEAQRLDFGPGGRHYMGNGWYQAELSGPEPLIWAGGEASGLRLPVVEPRDMVLRLDLQAFTFEGAPLQTVTLVRVDETRQASPGERPVEEASAERVLGTAELEPGRRQMVEIALSAADLVPGWNSLSLKWGWSRSPSEVSRSRDSRTLSAALYGLWMDTDPFGAWEPEPAKADADRIWLPANTRADFYLDLPAGSRFLSEVETRGDTVLSLETEHESGASVLVEVAGSTTQEGVALSPQAGIHRLRVKAIGQAGGGVMLRRPRIAAPAESPRLADSTEVADTPPDPGAAPAEAGNDLIFYSIDTLRADRLGFQGGPVPTPHFDALAEESLVFEHLLAQSPWTKASMASIFTGLWPPDHGAFNRRHSLALERLTLAELLNALGWETAAIVTNPNITANFGFDQGFEHFEYLGEKIPSEEVVAAVERFLDRRNDDRPLFLWIHVLDPHSPYDPPDAFRRELLPQVSDRVADGSLDLVNAIRAGRRSADPRLMAELWSLYDAEIVYADRCFGDLRRSLAERGLGDAVWTLISDHGEEFLEHGNLEHGRALHAESLDVPWTLSVPGVEPARIDVPAQHMDVLPTLLRALGVAIPKGLEGHAWLDEQGRLSPAEPGRLIFSHLHLDGAERLSVVDSRFKLMVEMSGDRPIKPRLFDLIQDRGETVDLWSEHPIRGGWLMSRIQRRRALVGSTQGAEVEIDAETRKSLEALGYL